MADLTPIPLTIGPASWEDIVTLLKPYDGMFGPTLQAAKLQAEVKIPFLVTLAGVPVALTILVKP